MCNNLYSKLCEFSRVWLSMYLVIHPAKHCWSIKTRKNILKYNKIFKMAVASRKSCGRHWCIHLMDFMKTKFRENHTDGHVGSKDTTQSIYKRRIFYRQELFFIVKKLWSRYLWFMIYSEEYFMYSGEEWMFCCYCLDYFLYICTFNWFFSSV